MTKPKTDAPAELKRPDLLFEFPKELERAPLKMSYGLEMDIRRMLPDPQTALNLLLGDPFTQDYIVRRCLTDKKAMINDLEDLIPQEEVTLDSDTVDALLMWVGEHALYFFAKRTTSLANLGVRAAENMGIQTQPIPSSSGSEASLSTKPSGGPSTE